MSMNSNPNHTTRDVKPNTPSLQVSVYEGVGLPDGTKRSIRLAHDGLYCSSKTEAKDFELMCTWYAVLSHKANKENQRAPKLKLQLMIPDELDEDQETQIMLQFQNRKDLNRIKMEITKYLNVALESDGPKKGSLSATSMVDVPLQWHDEPPMDESFQSHTSTTMPTDDEYGEELSTSLIDFQKEKKPLFRTMTSEEVVFEEDCSPGPLQEEQWVNAFQTFDDDLPLDESIGRNPPEPLQAIENQEESTVNEFQAFDEAAQIDAAVVVANAVPVPPGNQDDLEMQTLLGQDTQAATDDPAMWAITYQQLMDLEQLALESFGTKQLAKATMRDINRVILTPTCQQTGKSFALTHNPNGLLLDAFITHAWDEPFQDFVESIRHVFHTTMHKPNLWICACALFQGDSKQIAAQVGTSLEDSAFVRALSKASMYVVVRNTSVDLYSRIWCIAELLQSKKLGLVPDRAFVTGPDDFSSLNTSCLDAQAFNPKDRDRILKVLLNEHNREEIDDFVHQFRAFEPPRRKQDGLVLKMSFLVVGICLVALVAIVVAIVVGVVLTVTPSTEQPSQSPSFPPSKTPSMHPSSAPSDAPSKTPSSIPSYVPSFYPSGHPSNAPSSNPSVCPRGSITESGRAVEGTMPDPVTLGHFKQDVDKITQLRVWTGTWYGAFARFAVVGRWETTYRFKDGSNKTFSVGRTNDSEVAQGTITIANDRYLSKVALRRGGAVLDHLQFCHVNRSGDDEDCSARFGGQTNNNPQNIYSMEGQEIIAFGTKEDHDIYIDPSVGVYFREIGKC